MNLNNLRNSKRTFIPKNLVLDGFSRIEPIYQSLLNEKPENIENIKAWLKKRSELDAFTSEEFAWGYINFTRNTGDDASKERYEFLISDIQPKISPLDDQLNKHFLTFSCIDELEKELAYHILIRDIRNSVELFREENIPLFVELSSLAKDFSELNGAMTIEYEGKELTLQQASAYLEVADREVRKTVFNKITTRRLESKEKLDALFTHMVELRQEVASNACFENFRDYKFRSLGRFDFSIEQNLELQDSIRKAVLPVLTKVQKIQQKMLGLDQMYPYDLGAESKGNQPLKPFDSTETLVDKSIQVFDKVDGLGKYLAQMREGGFFDLDSRKGKAPGGYNYPLSETGMPFIFMNATGKFRDMVTLMHEGGHAIHSFLSADLDLVWFKHTPSEVAELASMSMELLSMDYWDVFFDNQNDLRRAKFKQLSGIVDVLAWVAVIDKFQHQVYTKKLTDPIQRGKLWKSVFEEYETGLVDYSAYPEYRANMWQKQLHIFEVPFYYIEYAISQLGAVAIWKSYREKGKTTIEEYLSALSLGYTKTVPEIYEAAGIQFSFSEDYIRELMTFVLHEIEKLEI